MNGIIKKYQNKIYEQESVYEELCESRSIKLKEIYENLLMKSKI